jgi:CheY-like chemotaxis protein
LSDPTRYPLDVLARSEGQWRRESDVRVLIVEDESLIAVDIEAALLADGHQVVGIATNEQEALELANEADLAFVDVKLADGLSGPLIGQKLEKGFGVAVIYVTGNPALVCELIQPRKHEMRDWPEASMAGQCSDEHFLAIALETGLLGRPEWR